MVVTKTSLLLSINNLTSINISSAGVKSTLMFLEPSDFIEAATDVPLRAVAQYVLQRGAVRLQDAIERYKASGGRAYNNSVRFFEHPFRHPPLSAFSGAFKLGWMLLERTEHYSVCARLLQRIRVFEDQQLTFNELAKDEYRELEQLMNADERVFARYLLARLCGAAEAKARFGITNSDVVEKKIADARARLDSAEGGCADTVRKSSRLAIKSPKKGGRIAWHTKEVAKAFVAEVEKTVLVYIIY